MYFLLFYYAYIKFRHVSDAFSISSISQRPLRGHHGRDRMVVGFTTTCATSAYHH